MSKLIIEMEMPKYRCADCDLSIDGFACKKARMDCGKCPICCELPDEHGDLIDRDHFKENLDMVCDAGGWLEPITQAVRVYCKKQVDCERAIVPATERSET